MNFFKKKYFLVFLFTLIIIFVLNISIIFFSKQLFNQKVFPRNFLNFFSRYYTIFYADINDRTYKNFTAIIGDSHAFGSGEEYLKNSYNYSIGHYLKQLSNNNNYVNFGFPGAGNFTSTSFFLNSINKKFIFPKIDIPNKIIYFFYEGNDLENNIHYLDASEELKLNIEVIKKIIDYFPIFNFISASIKYVFIKITSEEKELKNIIVIENQIIKTVQLQAPPIELNKQQIENAILLLEDSLKLIKKELKKTKIHLIYIPSPATIYDFKGKIFFHQYFNSERNFTNEFEINSISEKIRSKIEVLSQKIDVDFIDTTEHLKKLAKTTYLHGFDDPKHFNKKGYQTISRIICNSIKCD